MPEPSGGPLSAAEQYERLKHFLPMTTEPDTERPKPEDLKVGVRLRVEWSDAWWAARVRDEGDTRVKISYDTWSSQHDEWIPRDSPRFRLARQDDKDLEAEDAARPRTERFDDLLPEGLPVAVRSKPFVPKPYNPEREFQKRQLRLKEKIAAMQRVKLGAVDPSLSFLQTAGQASAPSADAQPEPEVRPARAELQATHEAVVAAVDEVLDVALSPPLQAKTDVVAASVPKAPQPAGPATAPQHTAQPTAAPAAEAAAGAASQAAAPQAAEAAPLPAKQTAAEAPAVAGSGAGGSGASEAVKWEEVLTGQGERYYHELSTGRTQWELPEDGWVQLLADDGSHYFWNAKTDVTQWVRPSP